MGIRRKERLKILKRDGYRCIYCGGIFKENKLTLDHVIPKSKKGIDGKCNRVTACKKCDKEKRDSLPIQQMDINMYTVRLAPQDPNKSHFFSLYQQLYENKIFNYVPIRY